MAIGDILSPLLQGLNTRDKQEQNKFKRKQQLLQLDDQRQGAIFQDARAINTHLKNGQIEQALQIVTHREGIVEQLGGDPTDVREIKDGILSGDIQGTINTLNSVEDVGMRATNRAGNPFLTDPRLIEAKIKKAGSGTSRVNAINELVGIAEQDPKGETIKGKAALIELGLIAKVSKTAAERIAENQQLADGIINVEREKSAAREEGKLIKQLVHKPNIAKAVKLAEKEAIERGDVLTSLQRSEAALPGLKIAVNELKELALISTSTFGGKLFDAAVKQSGFGATKGATARAKFIAIVNNQVLPLLKETFGAAFTFQEGESLKATMGDPDASPEEKMVQLDAFIAQKIRDIETKKRQLGQTKTLDIDSSTSSDDELKARLGI